MKVIGKCRVDFAAHTKLSCKVPISGWCANLLTSFNGEREDLHLRRIKPQLCFRIHRRVWTNFFNLYTFHFPVFSSSGSVLLNPCSSESSIISKQTENKLVWSPTNKLKQTWICIKWNEYVAALSVGKNTGEEFAGGISTAEKWRLILIAGGGGSELVLNSSKTTFSFRIHQFKRRRWWLYCFSHQKFAG